MNHTGFTGMDEFRKKLTEQFKGIYFGLKWEYETKKENVCNWQASIENLKGMNDFHNDRPPCIFIEPYYCVIPQAQKTISGCYIRFHGVPENDVDQKTYRLDVWADEKDFFEQYPKIVEKFQKVWNILNS
jgi:hypothetical protein